MIDALAFSRRIRLPQISICSHCAQQTRNATLIRRPRRPYTFTQLVTLSDGSSYLHRTTSPQPVYRTTKDVRNSVLWNPTNLALKNVEEDEAGRLAAFRSRFGGSYEIEDAQKKPEQEARSDQGNKTETVNNEGWDSLMDLISDAGTQESGSLTQKRKGAAKVPGNAVDGKKK